MRKIISTMLIAIICSISIISFPEDNNNTENNANTNTTTNTTSKTKESTPKTGDIVPGLMVGIIEIVLLFNIAQIVISKLSKEE